MATCRVQYDHGAYRFVARRLNMKGQDSGL